MTITFNKIMLAAMASALMATSVAARVNDVGGQNSTGGWSAYADQQAGNSEDSDPTSQTSVRSHGHP